MPAASAAAEEQRLLHSLSEWSLCDVAQVVRYSVRFSVTVRYGSAYFPNEV